MVAGNKKYAQGLETYLLSRDHSNLKSEFQLGNGKVCLCFVSLYAWVTIKRSLFWLKNIEFVSWSFLMPLFSTLQITVNCIENLPPVDLVLNEHLFLSVGDYFSRTQKSVWLDSHWLVFLFFLLVPHTTLFCRVENLGVTCRQIKFSFFVVHTQVLSEINASWSYDCFNCLAAQWVISFVMLRVD